MGFDIPEVMLFILSDMNIPRASLFAFLCLGILGPCLEAQESNAARSVHFGVYEAVTINRSKVEDVKIDKEGNVFLQ